MDPIPSLGSTDFWLDHQTEPLPADEATSATTSFENWGLWAYLHRQSLGFQEHVDITSRESQLRKANVLIPN